MAPAMTPMRDPAVMGSNLQQVFSVSRVLDVEQLTSPRQVSQGLQTSHLNTTANTHWGEIVWVLHLSNTECILCLQCCKYYNFTE